MVSPELRKIIEQKAAEFEIDPDLIESCVIHESSGNPQATRYEPAFYNNYIQPMVSKGIVTPEEGKNRATSWGLMQIMGETAREYGFKGEFVDLFDPATGLQWALLYFKHQLTRYKDQGEDYAIAAYNAGSAKLDGNKFRNQVYVDRTRELLKQIKEG